MRRPGGALRRAKCLRKNRAARKPPMERGLVISVGRIDAICTSAVRALVPEDFAASLRRRVAICSTGVGTSRREEHASGRRRWRQLCSASRPS